MRIDKYISLSLFSISSYLNIFIMLYVCYLYKIFDKLFPNFYIPLEDLFSFYFLVIILNILLLILFCIENLIRRKQPKLLPKINFKNKLYRIIYQTIFHIGYWFGVINILVTVITVGIIFS